MTTTNFTVNFNPSKKDIITRLFKEGHINIDEVVELMKEKETIVLPQQNPTPFPWGQQEPLKPWDISPQFPWGPQTSPFVGDILTHAPEEDKYKNPYKGQWTMSVAR